MTMENGKCAEKINNNNTSNAVRATIISAKDMDSLLDLCCDLQATVSDLQKEVVQLRKDNDALKRQLMQQHYANEAQEVILKQALTEHLNKTKDEIVKDCVRQIKSELNTDSQQQNLDEAQETKNRVSITVSEPCHSEGSEATTVNEVSELQPTLTNGLEEDVNVVNKSRSNSQDSHNGLHAIEGRLNLRYEQQTLLESSILTGITLNHDEGKLFTELYLLHPSRNNPMQWTIPSYQRLRLLCAQDREFRIFSRPFGIEKDNAVRCVLRLVAGVTPDNSGIQFAIEVLYATKYKRRFHFTFRLLDTASGHNRHLEKTFSSAEVCVPRYWFSQHQYRGTGLVSFAFFVAEDRLLREHFLNEDKLDMDVSLSS